MKTRPWWRRWWGIVLMGVAMIYVPWRFTIAPEPFASPQQSPAAGGTPWAVRLSGTPGATWYGGCTVITAATVTSPAATVTLPWTAHYGAGVQQLQCSFNNESPSTATTVLQIRYDGRLIAQTHASGTAGQVSVAATQP